MKTQINLIGLGTGSKNLLTDEAENALAKSEIVFGAKRILEIAGMVFRESRPFYRAKEIFDFLRDNPQYKNVSVVFSGDTGFFSGAKSFFEIFSDSHENLEGYELNVLPGISSAVYFASKLHKDWHDWKFLSLHGAYCNTIGQVRTNPACFFILSGQEDIKAVGEKIFRAVNNKILSGVKCWLGKNLSYPDEEIISINIEEMCDFRSEQQGLFVLLVENQNAQAESAVPCLDDEDFIRGEKIPMTKKEIRVLSLSALSLSKSSIIYDIGSGSGSITVEAARIATEGFVLAVEYKPEAMALTQKNAGKFCLENVSFVQGKAPECLEDSGSSNEKEFPAPTHVFIGGSNGNLREITLFALKKNPSVRIVANFVSLENLCEMQAVLISLEKEEKIKDIEISQVSVSRAEKAGDFHLMKALNPVYIVSFSGRG